MAISNAALQRSQLGRLLIARKLIAEDQLNDAIRLQQLSGKRLGEVLVEQGWVTQAQIARALRKQMGIRKLAAIVALVVMPFQMARAADVSPSNPDLYSSTQHDMINTFESQVLLVEKSGARGVDDLASIHQNDGEANLALILQAGKNNVASIDQTGGDHNTAAIIQSGNNASAVIAQSGKHNAALIVQR